MKSLHRYTLFASAAVAIALTGACAEKPKAEEEMGGDSAKSPATAIDSAERAAGGEDRVAMTAKFEPGEGARNASQPVSGTVTIFEADHPGGDYMLAVKVEGVGAGEHAWHIHSAPCGKEAPVVVPFTPTADSPGLDKPLTAGRSGEAEAMVTVPASKLSLEELRTGEYSLHVHEKGGIDHGPTLACANL